ncbi:orf1ab polyprotein [Mink coronavirus strain WD1127]|uniref:ORF1ab polyprotein n=1 Tax=Mink coronavirus strain WD1127 TaxID=766791 RepID=D9J1Z2_9ALPC|nr:orf1ab polyprotein [Mink coronavirus strain WD1127]ADI80512.1 orf1ab polyprotein [Mink coronavirus strain WD1127]
MGSKHFKILVVEDSEITAHGYKSYNDCSNALKLCWHVGFDGYVFVPEYSRDLLTGCREQEYVFGVFGANDNVIKPCFLDVQTANLQGFIVRSSAIGVEEDFYLRINNIGGTVVYVDQFLCGADGKPVRQGEMKDYFGDLEDIVIDDITYKHAWEVARDMDVPHAKQTALNVQSIIYLMDVDHKIVNGATRQRAAPVKISSKVCLTEPYNSLYKQFGSPYMQNGGNLNECFSKLNFIVANVKCKCGGESSGVGDWTGFKSACCGTPGKVIGVSIGDASVGEAVITSKGCGTGTKFYAGAVLKYVGDAEGVSVWRVMATYANDVVATTTFDKCKLALLDHDSNSLVANSVKKCYLTGEPDATVVDAIVAGHVNLSSNIFGAIPVLFEKTPWFVKKCGALFETAWQSICKFLSAGGFTYVAIRDAINAICSICFTIKDSKPLFIVSSAASSLVRTCVQFLESAFDIFTQTVEVVGVTCKCVVLGCKYLLFDNALVMLKDLKLKGKREAGLNTATFASAIIGGTAEVNPTRFENSTANLTLVNDVVQPGPGYAVVIGGMAFYCTGDYYFMMSSPTSVITTSVFKASTFNAFCLRYDVEDPYKTKLVARFGNVYSANGCIDDAVESLNVALKEFYSNGVCFKAYADKDIIVIEPFCRKYKMPKCLRDHTGLWDIIRSNAGEPGFFNKYKKLEALEDVYDSDDYKNLLCPKVLFRLDNGIIWYRHIRSVKNCKITHVTCTFTGGILKLLLDGYDALAGMITRGYQQLCKAKPFKLDIAGVTLNGFTTPIGRDFLDFGEDVVEIFCGGKTRCFSGASIPVSVEKIVEDDVWSTTILEETEYQPPKNGGVVVVIDGYTFYTCNHEQFYPFGDSKVVQKLYNKSGGDVKNVTFNDTVDVREVDPVFQVKITYEFDDDTITNVLKTVIGTSVTIEGNNWELLDDTLTEKVDAVFSQLQQAGIELPSYYIYDCAGGFDVGCNDGIMISQYDICVDAPLENVEEVSDVEVVDDPSTNDTVSEVVEEHVVVSEDVEGVVDEIVSDVDDEPITDVMSPFAFPNSMINGKVVLKQHQNNCWLNAAGYQLQCLKALEDESFKQYCAGDVAPFVQLMYAVTNRNIGDLGEAEYVLEQLLSSAQTAKVKLSALCSCGTMEELISGCVFRMRCTSATFDYGVCGVCKTVKKTTIVGIEGTGVFVHDPANYKPLVKPVCKAIFKGSTTGGHYMVHDVLAKVLVDGFGLHPVQNLPFTSVCFVNAKYVKEISKCAPKASEDPWAKAVDVQEKQTSVVTSFSQQACEDKPITVEQGTVQTSIECVAEQSIVVATRNQEITEDKSITVDQGTVKPLITAKPAVEPFFVTGNIKFYRGDVKSLVENLKPKVLVNAANSHLQHKGGVAKAIDAYTNGALTRESVEYFKQYKPIPPGNIVVFNDVWKGLNIANAVGPRVSEERCAQKLDSVYRKMTKIEGPILTPLISCGVFGVPLEQSLRSLLAAFKQKPICVFVYTEAEERKVLDYFKTPVTVVVKDCNKVTKNTVDASATIGVQLGSSVVLNDQDYSKCVPDLSMAQATITKVVDVDWCGHYGFENAAVFSASDHSDYKFESAIVNDKIVFKQSDNNCWVNSLCLLLQDYKPTWRFPGMEDLWSKFVSGTTEPFVHFLYFITGTTKGQPNDVELALHKLEPLLCASGSVTLDEFSGCDCCYNRSTISGPIVAVPLQTLGDKAVCRHGVRVTTRVHKIQGSVILTSINGSVTDCLKGDGYVCFTGSKDRGHYTYYSGVMYDADKTYPFKVSDLSVTSVLISNGYTVPVVQSPRITRDLQVVDNDLDAIQKLDKYANKFFKFGDTVAKTILAVFKYLLCCYFFLLENCTKSKKLKVKVKPPFVVKPLDVKLRALNSITLLTNTKFWFYIKFLLGLLLLYNLLYVVVSVPLFHKVACSRYSSMYANSSFVKSDVCSSSVLCKACLSSYEELSDFDHLRVVWDYKSDPLWYKLVQLFYFGTLMIFGNNIVRFCMLYFVAQLFNNWLSYYGLVNYSWFLNVVYFETVAAELVVIMAVIKVFFFLKHYWYGCDKADCKSCSKIAKQNRIPVNVVVNGSIKSVYVHTNGGSKFCKRHNFYCKNCDSYGSDNTFICHEIVKDLSSAVKHPVYATDVSFKEVDKVECSDGFYRFYTGDEYTRYNFDVTDKKYSCKEVLKSLQLLDDFVIYDPNGTTPANLHNACVYWSQLLGKPIKLVNRDLIQSLTVDFNGVLLEAHKRVVGNSFNVDVSNCKTLRECYEACKTDVPYHTFEDVVVHAHKYDVLMTDLSFNNFWLTYAKPEDNLTSFDIANCIRANAKAVNHSVLSKENVPIVWSATDFVKLSGEAKHLLIKTAKAKGVTIMITLNTNVMSHNLPAVAIGRKSGSGFFDIYNECKQVLRLLLAIVLVWGLFSCYNGYTPTYVTSAVGYDFMLIKNGKIQSFDDTIDCVHNVYKDFPLWYKGKYGRQITYSRACPIVVGTVFDLVDNMRPVPDVPAYVTLVGRSLIFAINAVFGNTDLCYDHQGVAKSRNSIFDNCVYNAACTQLTGMGGTAIYCFKEGVMNGNILQHKTYADIAPETFYELKDGNMIKLPTIIRGLGLRVVQTLSTTYCRVGECTQSKEGFCVGLDNWFVYDRSFGDGYICGDSVFGFATNVFRLFNQNLSVVATSGYMITNLIIALCAIAVCYFFLKFKRIFGDCSMLVTIIVITLLCNNISYFFTRNLVLMIVYATGYYFLSRRLPYPGVMDLGFIIAYFNMAPWWILISYLLMFFYDSLPSFFKLKVSTQLFEGDKFVGNFESAASGTFVIDMRSYETIVNSIPMERLKGYAATFNKYKYYTGSMGESDYRMACYAHLARALLDYSANRNDILYTPPTVSVNSTLQSGLRKIAQPSGIVEPCVVRVAYGNTVLNGLWLGDEVICPRHVIASDTTKTINYESDLLGVRLHNFSVSKGNDFLGVIGCSYRGVNLVIKVSQVNTQTPKHKFRTVKAGDSFNILACYDGKPNGVYGVNMRTQGTIRGSFINGTCGSPGYVLEGDTVHFVYMHHLELGNGSHVGSDFNGVMYGGYEDQPSLQLEGANVMSTDNVVAFLYAAIINGERWFINSGYTSLETFNNWARSNGYTELASIDVFSMLAAKTSINVERLLDAIMRLSTGLGGRTILGYGSLSDEFTPTEVVRQMFGVNLQSTKVKSYCYPVLMICAFLFAFWSEFFLYTPFTWFSPTMISCILFVTVVISAIFTTFVKHKMLYCSSFLLPSIILMTCSNLVWDYFYFEAVQAKLVEINLSLVSIDMQSVALIILCVLIACVHCYRFVTQKQSIPVCLITLCFVCYNLVVQWYYLLRSSDVGVNLQFGYINLGMMVVCLITKDWVVVAVAYRLAYYTVFYLIPEQVVFDFGVIKCLCVIYMLFGYVSCCYYGVLYWINRFTHMTCGVYQFCVSAAELKYMTANNLTAPTNAYEAMVLSAKLVGIGGNKNIKIASVQSKLTDMKCTNVVLLGLLSKMHVEANSKEWNYCVTLHNEINLSDDPDVVLNKLLALLAFFLSKHNNCDLSELIDSYFDNASILQSVASAYASLPSWVAYEQARDAYMEGKKNDVAPQILKQLQKAMNIAKAEFDREASVQKKLDRMAEQAASNMFKEARAVDRKSKIIGAMHSLLFSMLKRLDMSSVNTLIDQARNGCLPLSIIPAASATRLVVVTPNIDVFSKVRLENNVHYAGAVWSIIEVRDSNSSIVHLKEVTQANEQNLCWPLTVTCERVSKLQNNEIMPGKMKERAVKASSSADGDACSNGKALFAAEGGKHFMYALISNDGNLKYVKWEGNNDVITIELEQPLKFYVEGANGPEIKHLYFVKNLNTLRRGAVLGYIGATIRLQAGKQTEHPSNSSLLTLCAFAPEPAKAYVELVKKGMQPVNNCVKMLSNGSGNGMAITNGVEATPNQDSYGGASVCIYCRSHTAHPSIDGMCRFKGKFVQVPAGTADPIRFCIENDICAVCACWLNNGCVCDRTSMQAAVVDQELFKRVRGSSGARLEPCNGTSPDCVTRAFDVYNADVACIGKFLKTNCSRFKNLDAHDAYYIVKRCRKSVMDHEQVCYNALKHSNALASHDFFEYSEGRHVFGNVCRRNLTKYTMMDLCYALRNFDEKNCDVLKEILVLTNCCDSTFFDNPDWYDPVENEAIHVVYAKLGHIVANAMLKCVALCDAMVEKGYVGIITLDNQDLNGNFYDFGDFVSTIGGCGCACVTSYYSYMMPIMGMTSCLESENFVKSDIYGSDYKQYDLLSYDFTEHKEKLFNKYFKYWDRPYHPNCSDCVDDACILHCANFNTLFATTIPITAFGPLVRKVFIDGVPIVVTAGYHFKQLGLVWNKDVNVNNQKLSMTDLLKFVTDPSLLVASSPALLDQRTVCFSIAALGTGVTYQTVKPGHFNKEFYDFIVERGYFAEGSDLTLKHYFFAQSGEAAITDFNYYRYNRTTVLDICQAELVFQIVAKYFDCYDGGCITAREVVVTNYDKSAGYPLNKFGKARLYYETLSYEEQDELFATTKRNVLPTMTQMNLKYAISGKARARTVGGVSLLSTMTTRQYHQKHLKSIAATRNATVVIGTTKFYGGWDDMLKNLMRDVDNGCLMGWDYPKCDRALPNMIRMASAMILGSKHVGCCTHSDRFYRLSNELAQVLTEVVHCTGGFYIKPGGTTSGDGTTAYANSAFNIFQAVSANVNRLLSVDSNTCNNYNVKALQRKIYDNCYRSSVVDPLVIDEYYAYLRKHFSMMILSDDGVVCYNKEYADLGYVADISAFKSVLYYQNNVFMSSAKCWVEPDLSVGPHEFCSQHTMQIVTPDGDYYLPYPDPSRILSAGVFVDDIVKTDNVIMLERYVSLAIDAYPLTKHPKPSYQKVFYTLLEWVKHLQKTLNAGILDSFSVTMLEDGQDKFWSEEFYANLYEKSTVLQAAGMCVVCSSQTVLRCGDCLRRPLLCTKCAYDHVMGTKHHFIMSLTPYVCSYNGCNINDVTKLYLGGLNYYCMDHKPQLSFPLCANGNIFGLYKSSAVGSPDVEDFNRLATSDWSNVEDYKLANVVKESLKLFAAETIKATEESVKSQYACAVLKEVVGPKEVVLQWEASKTKPPLNRNSVFTCYQILKDSKVQLGEFVFEQTEYGGDAVYYKSTSTTKLVPGMIFVLTSHNVGALKAPVLVNQEKYSTISKLYPTFNIAEDYANLVPYYQMVGKQKFTTIQGPPGSGKSHCVIGLGLYYPGARIVYTACSHAAVDSLCEKAAKNFNVDKCSRIIPMRARVECYSGFKPNNNNAQYIFSTVNALPECNCDIVVVDEVSMCTNYELSVINSRVSYKHIVYVGDPQQLPAPRTLINKGVLKPQDYNVITQRMCTLGPDVFLHKCFRCPAEIVNTVSALVYENKFKPVKPESKQCFKMYVRGNVQIDNGSSVNRKQLEVVKLFLAKNPKWKNATFISPYNSQNYVARRLLGLQTQTVDSAQGSEYDFVVYTQTSDTAHAVNINRFNVAITRAKIGILCVMCDKAMYDGLNFYEIKDVNLQVKSEGCGLFKDCAKVEHYIPPAYATTYISLSDSFKTNNGFAVDVGNKPVTYASVISYMGFRFDANIPGYHTLFCTRDFAIRNVRAWLGFDVESAHVCGDNIGTNVPLQLGFSNGVDFVVQPEGCVVTDKGSSICPVKSRAPPGEQFAHLIPLMRRGQAWSIVRRRIVQMVCDYFDGLSDVVIFVLWAGGLELTTMRYFVKIGVPCKCDCGVVATCYNSAQGTYHCMKHALGCDYLYNPYCIDIQQWGYTGSLSMNHHEVCNVHRNEHVASGDATMTRCLAVHDCFVKRVDWSITYPFIDNEATINKAGRVVQSHVVRAAIKVLNPSAIHDVGNPKGIRCVTTPLPWFCYDKDPINSNVRCLDYDFITHGQMPGLMLFWNCNVDMYPECSVVCRFDTRTRSKLSLEGCNGGALYVNNHAFHTEAYDRRAFAKLKPLPFFFFDDSTCELVDGQPNYVPLKSNVCITRCNIGGAVCKKHAALYRKYVEDYNTFVQAGFTIWGPSNFDTYTLWQGFVNSKALQSLENVAYNVVKKGVYTGLTGDLPTAIVADKVLVRDGSTDRVLFTNKTMLPTNVAFELYAKRKVGLTPPLTILRNLDVVATYKFVLWDYEAECPFSNFTKEVCGYTDLKDDVVVCYDNSIVGSYERFTTSKDGVLISNSAIKGLVPIALNFGYLNNLPVSTVGNKPVKWYIYVRKNGVYVEHIDGFYSQGRTFDTFKARSKMEEDFLSMDTTLFIQKYGLEDYGFEHVVFGDVSKTTLGGMHLLISQVRLSKMGLFSVQEFMTNSDSTLKSCCITYADDPSSKSLCTYMDILLDDFVTIVKGLDLSVVSKVVDVVVDCKVWRWMLWCENATIKTFYPQLQSAEWKPGYSMPNLYKIQRMCLERCNLYNYGASLQLPDGITTNVIKYTQLCQYLNTTSICVPHKMRVLHLGASSHDGVAPGTSVLRRWLPDDAILVDNDVRDYISDADFSITGDCTSMYLEDKFDLLISDMYDSTNKSIDGNNVSKEGFFPYINGFIREKLSLGGSVAIKLTEYSWNKELYELIQRFEYWTMFCTSVNTSSSEAFLIGVNYMGDYSEKCIIDGNVMHANYIFWRNSTVMALSYYSVFDLTKFKCKFNNALVVNLKDSDINVMVKGLIKGGKLLVRNNGKLLNFGNHLVNV